MATPAKKPTTTTTYRYIGYKAQILEGGRPLAPGDFVELTVDDFTGNNNINQTLLDDGKLIDASGLTANQTINPEGGDAT